MTSFINDGGAQVNAVYIHDLYLRPNVAYDEALNFDGNSASDGTIENVRIHTVNFQTGMKVNGLGWQIKDCYIEADDTAINIHANATEIDISGLYTGRVNWDNYAVIINGDRNILRGSVITRGLHVVGDENLITDNLFSMYDLDTGAGSKDAITLSGDRNFVIGNKVEKGGGTGAVLDGVSVLSGATDNIVAWNDLRDTTTAIDDAGTGTIVWDADALTGSLIRVERITTAQTISNDTGTTLIVNSIIREDDPTGRLSMNTSTGVLTINESGWYSVSGGVLWEGSAVGRRIMSLKGSTRGDIAAQEVDEMDGTSTFRMSASGIAWLVATEQVVVNVYQNSGGDLDAEINVLSYLSVAFMTGFL